MPIQHVSLVNSCTIQLNLIKADILELIKPQSEIALGFLPQMSSDCPLTHIRFEIVLRIFLGLSLRSPQIVRYETARQCCVMSVQSALDVSANYICGALQQ